MARIGSYYVLAAGILRGDGGFDLLKEIAALERRGDSIDELAGRTATKISERLSPLLTRIRMTNPALFRESYGGKPATQVVLLGANERGPEVKVVQFVATEDSETVRAEPVMLPCPGRCRTYGYSLGTVDRIAAALHSDPTLYDRASEQQVERLIGLEYRDRPDAVGGPLAMVKVTRAGVARVRNGACAADPESQSGLVR